jgi:hypothetical protein
MRGFTDEIVHRYANRVYIFIGRSCRTPIRHAGQHSAPPAKVSVIRSDVSGITPECCPPLVRNPARHGPERASSGTSRELYLDKTILDANKKAAKLAAHLTRVSSAMREKYSVKTRQGIPVTRLVAIVNAFAPWSGLPPLPKVGVSVPVPHWLRDLRRERGFCAIYRNVASDLATFGSLGELRDVLSKRVVIDEQLRAYSPKSEDPRYRFAHSEFKSPM